MSKDYYKTIGVDKKAGADEIRKAYYKLAHQHHPHKGGDEAKMKEINEAYGVLGNQEKRSQYDQFGSTFEQARSQCGSSGFGDFSGFARNADGQPGGQSFSFEFGDLGDLFGDLFGGGRRGQSRRASRHSGQDIQAELAVNFSEAVFGTEKVLRRLGRRTRFKSHHLQTLRRLGPSRHKYRLWPGVSFGLPGLRGFWPKS